MNLLLDRTHTSLDNLKPLNTMFVIDVVFWKRSSLDRGLQP